MRAAALHTLLSLLTTEEYRRQHDNATIAALLSPQTEALLQALDSIQPAIRWEQAEGARFTPMDVDYNPLQLQAQPYTIALTSPDAPTSYEKYSIRPPGLRTHARGDAA